MHRWRQDFKRLRMKLKTARGVAEWLIDFIPGRFWGGFKHRRTRDEKMNTPSCGVHATFRQCIDPLNALPLGCCTAHVVCALDLRHCISFSWQISCLKNPLSTERRFIESSELGASFHQGCDFEIRYPINCFLVLLAFRKFDIAGNKTLFWETLNWAWCLQQRILKWYPSKEERLPLFVMSLGVIDRYLDDWWVILWGVGLFWEDFGETVDPSSCAVRCILGRLGRGGHGPCSEAEWVRKNCKGLWHLRNRCHHVPYWCGSPWRRTLISVSPIANMCWERGFPNTGKLERSLQLQKYLFFWFSGGEPLNSPNPPENLRGFLSEGLSSQARSYDMWCVTSETLSLLW